jgi:hypothetical protein
MGVYRGLAIETTLDPKIQPFLHDHQIESTAVLPGVMGIEAFAEAASHMVPGWHIEAVEDVNFLAPFKFYRNEPRALTIESTIRPYRDALIGDCKLIGRRTLPNQTEPQVTTHFTGRVRLARQRPISLRMHPSVKPVGHMIKDEDIYRLYFHGPAYQVVNRAWWDGNRVIGLMAKNLRNNHHPTDRPTMMAPRLIELCFQTAGLWEMGVQGRFGLPQHVDRISLFGAMESVDGDLYAVVTPHPEGEYFDAEILDTKGSCYLELRGYRTVAIPNAMDAEHLKTLQGLMTAEAVLVA